MKDLQDLSEIAKENPQNAYSAYTKGLSHKWANVQRTIKDISHLFSPLEKVLRDDFIPTIVGRTISDIERQMIALPLRFGGLGIQNPVDTANREYTASNSITKQLQSLIFAQDTDLGKMDKSMVAHEKEMLKADKELFFKAEYNRLHQLLPAEQQKTFEEASQKGASAWLSALPLKAMGYCLNKSEFKDSICLRYGWKIADIHTHCACGKPNDINHVQTCTRGGYIIFRHNALRDTEAVLLKEVCKDVRTEPMLLPTDKNGHPPGTIVEDQARLDIVGTGLWGTFERTYFDIRVTHPVCKTHSNTSLEKLLSSNEKAKHRSYSSRVINTERSSFVPLVFSTGGSAAKECDRHHRRVAELIANRRKEPYSDILSYIRTRVRFALLRSVLMAVRGIRGKSPPKPVPMAYVPFNFIPSKDIYECR